MKKLVLLCTMIAIAVIVAGICSTKVSFEIIVMNTLAFLLIEMIVGLSVFICYLGLKEDDIESKIMFTFLSVFLGFILWIFAGGSCLKQLYYSTYKESITVSSSEVVVESNYIFRSGVKMHGKYNNKPCIINYHDYDSWTNKPTSDSVRVWIIDNPKLENIIFNCGI